LQTVFCRVSSSAMMHLPCVEQVGFAQLQPMPASKFCRQFASNKPCDGDLLAKFAFLTSVVLLQQQHHHHSTRIANEEDTLNISDDLKEEFIDLSSEYSEDESTEFSDDGGRSELNFAATPIFRPPPGLDVPQKPRHSLQIADASPGSEGDQFRRLPMMELKRRISELESNMRSVEGHSMVNGTMLAQIRSEHCRLTALLAERQQVTNVVAKPCGLGIFVPL